MKSLRKPYVIVGILVFLGVVGFLAIRARPSEGIRVRASLELIRWVDKTLGGVELTTCRAAEKTDDKNGYLERDHDVILQTRAGKPFIVSRLIRDPEITSSPFWKKFEEDLNKTGASVADLDHRSCAVWKKAMAAHSQERTPTSQPKNR